MKHFAHTQRGMTLVELMIAVTVSLILLAGILEVYVSSRQTYTVQNAVSRLQENGRFSTSFLTRDVRMAGFMGCPGLTNITPNILAKAPPVVTFDVDSVISGHEATGASLWSPALPGAIAGLVASGTDVIVVQNGGSCSAPLTSEMISAAAGIQISDTNACDFQAGDVLFITDCETADIFKADSVIQGGGAETIAHTSVSNTSGDLSKSYGTDAEVFKLQTVTYFIAPTAGASGRPSLWRQIGTAAAEELVEGVEDMQILYGEDINNDRTADRYLTANDPNLDMGRVVSTRISLLTGTLEDNIAQDPQTYVYNSATVTATDRRVRRVLTTTVNLRNRTP